MEIFWVCLGEHWKKGKSKDWSPLGEFDCRLGYRQSVDDTATARTALNCTIYGTV